MGWVLGRDAAKVHRTQRPAPPRATGWDKAAVLGRLLWPPRPPGPGQAAFLQQGQEKKSLVCMVGKGGGLAAAGRRLVCGGRYVSAGGCVLSGAACSGKTFPRVECVV